MKNGSLKEYRTFVIAIAAIGALTYCAAHGGVKGEDLANVKWGLAFIVATVAGRSVGRAAAGGGGWQGMKDALLTPAKPEGGAAAAP
jgi:hypothetical protein